MAAPYVLIVEPDIRVARTFELLAREAGLEAILTRDGSEALTVIQRQGKPGLLVTNLVLPKVDGFMLLGELRKTVSPADMPAIVVSSAMHLRNTALKERARFGITEIVASGMSANTLRAAMHKALATGPLRVQPLAATQVSRPPPAKPSKLPTQDPARLKRIESMRLLDDGPQDATLERLVEDTARAFNVPIALVSLVLEDRQWFKAHVGLRGELANKRGTPIEQAFCRHVVDSDEATPLIVPDARRHPSFSNNQLVKDGAVGSYLGAPLLTSDGKVLGTLCIIDDKPLQIGYDEVDLLVTLARRVAGELELRHSTIPPKPRHEGSTLEHDLAALAPVLSHLECGVVLLDRHRQVTYVNDGLTDLLGFTSDELVGMPRDQFVAWLAGLSDQPDEIMRRMRVHHEGPFLAREELTIGHSQKRVLRWTACPVRLPSGTAQLATYTDITAEVNLREFVDAAPFMDDDVVLLE